MPFPLLLAPRVPAAPPIFAVGAEALPSATRLRFRLSVRNASDVPQKLWLAATGSGCTSRRWSVSEPSIQLEPFVDATKVCWAACEHFRVLRPGETFSAIYEPSLNRRKRFLVKGRPQDLGLRPGPTALTFTLAQPNLATIWDATLPESRRYRPRLFASPPLRVDLKPAWLSGS